MNECSLDLLEEDVKFIVGSLTDDERRFLGDSWSQPDKIVFRQVKNSSDGMPIAFIDLYQFNLKLAAYVGIVVHPNYRRQHIASRLVHETIQEVRKIPMQIQYLGWLVDNANLASVHLAESLGFQLKQKKEKESIYIYRVV